MGFKACQIEWSWLNRKLSIGFSKVDINEDFFWVGRVKISEFKKDYEKNSFSVKYSRKVSNDVKRFFNGKNIKWAMGKDKGIKQ